jgi:hypothetical protein
MSEASILTKLKIDINPDGISLSLEGIDADIAKLIQAAGDFTVTQLDTRNLDVSDVVIKSVKSIQFVDRVVTP